MATGAAAQGVSGDVRYSGVLSCMSDPEVAALRIENVVPNRLLPSATYIAPANPVCVALIASDTRVVTCTNETVLDGVCPSQAAQAAAPGGLIGHTGDGLKIDGVGDFDGGGGKSGA